MKVLSIKQPWAWLIANGHKNIENRDWKYAPKYRGKFWIHAGKQYDKDCFDEHNFYNDWAIGDYYVKDTIIKCPPIKEMGLGGIVGCAEIIDVVYQSDSPWFNGPMGFVLIKAHPVEFQPLKGQLGFFNVPDHLCEICFNILIGDDSGYCDKCDHQREEH